MKIRQNEFDEVLDEILTLLEQGERKLAKPLVKQLAKQFPQHPESLFVQGLLAAYGDNLHSAVKFWLQTLAKKPDHSLAHFNLGTCYGKLKHYDKVVLHFYRALQTADEDELEQMQRAREVIDSIQADLPDGFTIEDYLQDAEQYQQAFELMEQGDYPTAADMFSRIADHQPKHVSARGNLGVCHLRLGNYQKAREALQQALALDPDYVAARSNMQCLENLESGKTSGIIGSTVINRGL